MISKNDIILLLTELQDNGIDIENKIADTFKSQSIPIDVLKFINQHRQLDLTAFYEKLRKSYNHKRSKLYKNILDEALTTDDILTTLSSYELQAILFSKTVLDKDMFLSHARVKEINLAIAQYLTDFDISICKTLLRLIKADLIACETISGRREEA